MEINIFCFNWHHVVTMKYDLKRIMRKSNLSLDQRLMEVAAKSANESHATVKLKGDLHFVCSVGWLLSIRAQPTKMSIKQVFIKPFTVNNLCECTYKHLPLRLCSLLLFPSRPPQTSSTKATKLGIIHMDPSPTFLHFISISLIIQVFQNYPNDLRAQSSKKSS